MQSHQSKPEISPKGYIEEYQKHHEGTFVGISHMPRDPDEKTFAPAKATDL